MAPTMGFDAALGIGASNPVDLPLEFISETLKKTGTVMDSNGIRGSRSIPTERTRANTYTVSGQITMEPGPVELDYLLPWIMGSAKDGSNQFPLAETVVERYVTIDRKAKVFTYAGCVVSRMTLRGSEGQALTMMLDIEGKTETIGNAGSFPSLTLSTLAPYMFYDAALTIGGTGYSCKDFEIVLDHQLRPRFLNSQTRTAIPGARRIVTCSFTVPYTSNETGLYDNASGAAVTLALTNGNYSLSLALANVISPAESPTITGPDDEIYMVLRGQGRSSGSTSELIVTNDSTP